MLYVGSTFSNKKEGGTMRWRDIPRHARAYILYHVIVSPLLITWYMVPLYMYMTGYNVLEIGVIFTAVEILSIPVTYVIGRIFERVPIKHGLILIDALEGTSCIFYGLAYGPIAPIMLLIGLVIDDVSSMFYPLYQAAERLLYPKDRMEEVFAWHVRLPELSQLFGFLVLGYIFGYVFTSPKDYRLAFFFFGASSLVTMAYLALSLPRMDAKERVEVEKFEFRVDREFRLILLMEALTTLAWSMAPEIVLLNYVINVLGKTLFEVMIIEGAISIGAIAATYMSERISRERRFLAIGIGYSLISLWALIMFLGPSLYIAVIAYAVSRFGDTLAFPFYRSWVFGRIPGDKASTVLSALASYRKIIAIVSPALAGLLASIMPTLPYLVSLLLFIASSVVMIVYDRLTSSQS